MRLAFLFLCASLAWSADPAFVQSVSASTNGVVATQAAVEGSNVTSGNTLVVFVGYNITAQTVSIADSVGTTYAQKIAAHSTAGNQTIETWCGVAAGTGANTVTATSGTSNFFQPFIIIQEYSNGTCTTDGTGSNDALSAPGSINLTSSAITTTQAKDIIAAAAAGSASGFSWTAGTSFTLRESSTGVPSYGAEDFLTSTTVTNSCPITPNNNAPWTGQCIIVKGTAAATKRRGWIGD